MASKMLGQCCFKGFYRKGETKGLHKDIFGVDSYVVGLENPSDKVVVIMTDVYGNRLNNVLLTADQIAESGYQVYVPDILFNNPALDLNVPLDIPAWMASHPVDRAHNLVTKYLSDLRKHVNPKFVGIIGYCYGAKFAIKQIDSASGIVDACAIAHPSLVTIEDVAAIGKPLLISAAEEDAIFPEEMRHLTEAKLKEIGARYEIDLFSGVEHGFASRGDVSNPVVKFAMNKALADQLYWFDHFASGGQ